MVGLYGGAHPISTVLFPFKMMTIEGSYVGTLDDLRELLALVQAGKVPPIPIETRPADQASAALSDLKSWREGARAGGAAPLEGGRRCTKRRRGPRVRNPCSLQGKVYKPSVPPAIVDKRFLALQPLVIGPRA